MFGKKKAPLPEGIRLMHYEGLPSFAQDAPCFMEQTAEALVFRRVEGPSVTLPLAKRFQSEVRRPWLPYFAMKGSRIMCSLFTFPTPVHIGDAMFIH